jgi:rRNA maturation endonuclease Nob1
MKWFHIHCTSCDIYEWDKQDKLCPFCGSEFDIEIVSESIEEDEKK